MNGSHGVEGFVSSPRRNHGEKRSRYRQKPARQFKLRLEIDVANVDRPRWLISSFLRERARGLVDPAGSQTRSLLEKASCNSLFTGKRAQPGFEPGTSCTLSRNHTPRPLSHKWAWAEREIQKIKLWKIVPFRGCKVRALRDLYLNLGQQRISFRHLLSDHLIANQGTLIVRWTIFFTIWTRVFHLFFLVHLFRIHFHFLFRVSAELRQWHWNLSCKKSYAKWEKFLTFPFTSSYTLIYARNICNNSSTWHVQNTSSDSCRLGWAQIKR